MQTVNPPQTRTTMDAPAIANQLVVRWRVEGFAKPDDERLFMLQLAITRALNDAWFAGFQAGWQNCEAVHHDADD